MPWLRNHKRKLITMAIVLALFLVFYETGFTARIVFPYGIIDKIRSLITNDHISFAASKYKDGTILLIKPIATGVGDGRYEAGDIVSILDGEEIYKRFGDSDFLGYEEKSKLIPLYLAQKLTEEQKQELLASAYETHPVSDPASAGSEPPLLLEGNNADKAEDGEKIPSKKRGALSASEGRGVSGDDNRKMTKRRTYGVDYTLVLSDKDILTIRQEKALDRIPEVRFEEIINKENKLSYADKIINDQFSIINQLSMIPSASLGASNDQNSRKTGNSVIENWKIKKLIDNWSLKIENYDRGNCSDSIVVCLPNHLAIMENAIKASKRLAAFIVPNVRAATESVKTVDTGGYADYTSLSAWEAANQADLTLSDTIAIAKCQHKTSSSTSDTEFVITGWTTDSTRYIKIWTDPIEDHRHNGQWNDDKYIIERDDSGADIVQIYESNVHIEGIQFYWNQSVGYGGAIQLGPSAGEAFDIRISHSIFKGNSTLSEGAGINENWLGDAHAGSILRIYNNIFYNFTATTNGSAGIFGPGGAVTQYIINNSFYNCGYGIHMSWAPNSATAKNNLIASTTFPAVGTFAAGTDYNSTASSSVGYSVTGSGNTHDRTSQNLVFADVANNDFHLYATDATAQDYGTSSVSEIGFATDIDGQTRTGTWDIGADEMIARPVYRSVGPGNTNTISSGWSGTTLTISGDTATFSSDQPDNMGVGDVIFYANNEGMGTAATNSIAFIHGRNGPRSYIVKDENGYLASSTYQTTTKWAIYRAYTSLDRAATHEYLDAKNDGFPETWYKNFDYWSYGKNLASSTQQWNIACYADAGSNSYTDVNPNWVTSTSTYMKIYTPYLSSEVGASQRHSGRWDETKFYNAVDWDSIQADTGHIVIEGLQLKLTGSNTWRAVIRVSGTTGATVTNNLVRGAFEESVNANIGIYRDSENYGEIKIYNNIVYGFINNSDSASGNPNSGIVAIGNSDNIYIYNNTVYNSYRGIVTDSGASPPTLKNNIVQACPEDYYNTFNAASDYNLSDKTNAPGAHAVNNATVLFVDKDNNDFHLAHSDSNAKDAGADLSADINLPFSTDIDGNARPSGRAWDIGADEATAGAVAGINPYARFKDSSLVGYWSFDGSDMDWASTTAEVLDRSGYSNHGNITSDVKNNIGIIGQALELNGRTNDDFLPSFKINPSNTLDDLGPMTISFWSNLYGANDIGEWTYLGKIGGSGGWLVFSDSNYWIRFEKDYSNSDVWATTNFNVLVPGRWQHVAISWDGTANKDNIHFYVDSLEEEHFVDGNGDGVKNSDAGNTLYVANNSVSANKINGVIDEIRIYNRVLSATEIADLYRIGASKAKTNTQVVGNKDGLVGYWSFDGKDMDWGLNRATDLSGLGNHGTLISMSTSSSPAIGMSGQALLFDGCTGCPMDDYISAGSAAVFDQMENITVSAWIYPKSGGNEGGGAAIINKDNGSNDGWVFYISSSGYINFSVNYANQDMQKRSNDGAIQFNTWQHVAATFASGTSQTLHANTHIYINGVEPTYSVTNDGQGSRNNDSNNDLSIGVNMFADHFDGPIDEVRVYNRALFADEIGELYRQGGRRTKLKTY